MNIVEFEVINRLLSAIAEEMGIVVRRAAFSPNIKERRDYSCAIFDKRGELLAQAAHIPVHLGAMPLTIKAVTEQISLKPGDVIITNDPFQGGTHLPDITVVRGVFFHGSETPDFFLVCRAHHADVGGSAPGSMALASSIHEEGILIRPSLLYQNGELNQGLLEDFLARVRNPRERQGDLDAQVAALMRGEVRLKELVEQRGRQTLETAFQGLLDYGERVMKSVISEIPDGVYTFSDALDDNGSDAVPVPISVQISIRGDRSRVDFSGSAPQQPSGINAVKSVTASAVYYVFSCLLGGGYPINGGLMRPIEIVTQPGTVVDAAFPAAVAGGNVETSQRIVDCILGALAKAIPQTVPAASCGSMNNIAVGGYDSAGSEYAYYETIGGGMGARPGSPGLSAVHTHMTNTLNTPVEALEQTYPFLVERYCIRRGSGGKGLHPGGDGIIRRYRFLRPATVSLMTERRRLAPYGLNGGRPAKRGLNILIRKGKRIRLKGKTSVQVESGDSVEIRTPGGGGWGSPLTE